MCSLTKDTGQVGVAGQGSRLKGMNTMKRSKCGLRLDNESRRCDVPLSGRTLRCLCVLFPNISLIKLFEYLFTLYLYLI